MMSRNAEQKKRLEWLDFGKAMGILVVLAVHAGCSLGALTYYGGMFYMPIFFFAAGYTFRRKEGESYGAFLWKKAKRLLIPYFGTSAFLWLFFYLKDSVLSGNPGDLKIQSLLGILYSRNQMWQRLCRRESCALESSEFSVVVSDSSFSGLCLVWTDQ